MRFVRWFLSGAMMALVAVALSTTTHASEIIAFDDAGHSSTGAWVNNGTGFNEKWQNPADGGQTSTYDFTGLAGDTYYVYANWTEDGNRTTVAQYAITDGGGVSVQNQKQANNDVSAGGDMWSSLGSVSVADGTLSVTASDLDPPGDLGFLMADAVRIATHHYHETSGGGMVIDSMTGIGFSKTGIWGNSWDADAFLAHNLFQDVPGGNHTATWSFSDLDAGAYSVHASWSELSNRTEDADYTISDGGGVANVDQRNNPTGLFDDVDWQLLNSSVIVTDGTLEIVLTDNDPAKFLMADAVRIELVGPVPEPASLLLLGLGGLVGMAVMGRRRV